MKRLFIAEKPELAKAIVEGLGGGSRQDTHYICGQDKVTWCIGHMLEMYTPEDYDAKYKKWLIDDLPIYHPEIKHKIKTNTKSQFLAIQRLMNEADTIVNAGDPDPAGQQIIDEILDFCKNKKPVLRFMTNDNNLSVIKKALNNLTNNSDYYQIYQSALARSWGDQLYGFNMTRAYTVKAKEQGYEGIISVGRVQTPILGLVVRRDRLNANHEKQFYFEVIGDFNFINFSFPAKYIPLESSPVDDKKRLTDKDYALKITNDCSKQPASIISSDSSVKELSPPLPYSILKLQVAAAKQYNYKPDRVMKITQELREKYKLITYNGTDCQYLNEEQHIDAPHVLNAISKTAAEYTDISNKADPKIMSRAFNNKNVSAHHAIIPTQAVVDLSTLKEPLRNIYLLVAQAYIAQFYPKQQYRETKIVLNCATHQFNVRSKIVVSDGWKILYKQDRNDDSESDESIAIDLSSLITDDSGQCVAMNVLDKETKPLPLYTMAALLNDLTKVAKYIKDPEIKKLLIAKDKDKKGENGGIGTSRTRDVILARLFKVGFLAEKGKKVISTAVGQQLFDSLPEIATNPDMTALWHEQQSLIESGDNTTLNFITELVSFISKQVADVKVNGLTIAVESHKCHKCDDGFLRRRGGASGVFWACNKYPDCNATLPNKSGKPDYKSLETHSCPGCNSNIKRIKGKFGFFWPCPNCKSTFKDKKGKPDTSPKKVIDETKFKCEDCDKPLVRRVKVKGVGKNKKEIPWYGCSGFPACKRTYFDQGGKPKY